MSICRRLAVAVLLLLAGLAVSLSAQSPIAARLYKAIVAAGVPAVGVSIGDAGNKATWVVDPPTLQAAAQPTIDAFNAADPAHQTAELDAQVKAALDNERLFSAIVWTIIDTYSPPATITKYNAARTKIIAAYKSRPWLP